MRTILYASVMAISLSLWTATATAQLTTDQQACVNALNTDGARVAQAQAKANVGCLKSAGAGTLTGTAQTCLTADPKMKLARKQAKTTKDEATRCASAPTFGYTSAAVVNTAGQQSEIDLVGDVFGSPLDAAVVRCASNALQCKCQQQVLTAVEKLAQANREAFLKCKKLMLATATGIADLANCETDPATPGSIAAESATGGKIDKSLAALGATIAKSCDAPAVTSGAFPGPCAGLTGPSLSSCLDLKVESRVCETLNDMDGLGVDCSIFDDVGPGVTVSGSPAQSSTVSTTSASFTFTPIPADEPEPVAYECQFNTAPGFTACNSGFIVSGLIEGSQTLRVRATDRFGNLGAVVTYGWTISALESTILDVRTGTVPPSTRVHVAGATRMTGKTADRFWCQDVDGGATNPDHHGITVAPLNFNASDPSLVPGRALSIYGTVALVNGNPTLIDANYTTGGSFVPYSPRSTNRDSALLLSEANVGLLVDSTGTASTSADPSCQNYDFCIVSCARATPVIFSIDGAGTIVLGQDHNFVGIVEGAGASFTYFVTDAVRQSDACL